MSFLKVSRVAANLRERHWPSNRKYIDGPMMDMSGVTTNDFSVGDLAYVKTYVAPKELSKKLIFPAVGPFIVSRVGADRRT